jgi:hypothetical protein
MQASHLERLGVGPFDPHCVSNLVMTRFTYAGSRAGFEATRRAISADRPQPVIDRVFRFVETNEPYRHIADRRHVRDVVISRD